MSKLKKLNLIFHKITRLGLEDVYQFQRVIWQHRLLPYQAELEEEADNYFSNIKFGLDHTSCKAWITRLGI